MKLILGAAAMLVVAAVVALVSLMGEDPAPVVPQAFSDDLGKSAMSCRQTCDFEAKCARPSFSSEQCFTDCSQLLQIRFIQPACAAQYTAGLNCYADLSRRCGPADGCAAQWAAAFECTCAQPDIPAEMHARCGK